MTHPHTATGRLLTPTSPATGEVVATAPVMDQHEVLSTVASARNTAGHWAALSPRERGRHLLTIRDTFADNAVRLVEATAEATGKPLADSWFEVVTACTTLSWAARVAPRKLRPRTLPSRPFVLKRVRLHHEPHGVIGVISTDNHPIAIPLLSIPSALVAGNVVVLKPGERAVRVGQLIGEIVAATGLDLVRVVTGDGTTGEALMRSGVDKIFFTGSVAVGKQVLHAAADSLTPVVLELGGNDPMIVWDNADVEQAARAAVRCGFANAGQTCMSIARAVVGPAVHDRFVAEVLAAARQLTVGLGSEDHIGPLLQAEQAGLLRRRLADAVAGGARILLGGQSVVKGQATFFEPTVVVDVDPRCELFREENFGPILSIVRADSEEEAVGLANATGYGLGSSVFTRSGARARRLASRIIAGTVDINDAVIAPGVPSVPFGGTKNSGMGRMKGVAGLREFTRTKTVVSNRFPGTPSIAALLLTGGRSRPEPVAKFVRLLWANPLLRRFRRR